MPSRAAGSCRVLPRRVGEVAGNGAGVSTHHLVAETNDVAERFHHSLKHEYFHQREIDTDVELAEEVAGYVSLYNEIRPHQTPGQRRPLAARCAEMRSPRIGRRSKRR